MPRASHNDKSGRPILNQLKHKSRLRDEKSLKVARHANLTPAAALTVATDQKS